MNKCFSNYFPKIYLLLYSFYIFVITFSNFTAYAQYLHIVYKLIFIAFIFINLIFLCVAKDEYGNKSYYDYIIIIVISLLLVFRIFFNVRVMTISLLSVCLFIANLKYVSLKKFIKVDFKTKFVILLTVFILYLCHLSPDRSITSISYRHGIMQLGGGFGNDNVFAAFTFYVIIMYILFVGKNICDNRHLLYIFISILFVFFMTDSRGFIISSVILLLLLIFYKIRFIHEFIRVISLIFITIMSFIAIILPESMSPNSLIFHKLNKLLSNRLLLQHIASTIYPVKLFGYSGVRQWLKFYNSNNNVYIDNTYLMLAILGGFIGFIIFEFIYIKACSISVQCDKYLLCIIFISLSLFFVVEDVSDNINVYSPIICAYIIGHSYKYKINKG